LFCTFVQLNMSSTDRRAARPTKPTLIVTLQVPPATLAKYTPKTVSKKLKIKQGESPAADSPAPAPSDVSSTPAAVFTPNNTELPPVLLDTRRKGIPGPKPGTKRGPVLGPDGQPRPRGKPGPKKKPRLEDGTIDHSAIAANRASGGTLAHKLGPKANQGAINAGLRALDRSGAPCRRWQRKGIQLKSFTGVLWGISTWRTPKPTASAGGSTPNGDGTTVSSDSAGKENRASSAVSSEKSNSGIDTSGDVNDTLLSTGIASVA